MAGVLFYTTDVTDEGNLLIIRVAIFNDALLLAVVAVCYGL